MEELADKAKKLQEKVDFFRENQKMLSNDEQMQKANFDKIVKLETALEEGKDDRRKVLSLEKTIKLLEDKIRSRDPNDTALLIRAATAPQADDDQIRKIKQKCHQLEQEMAFKDEANDKKLRTYRQEIDRIKAHYEKKAGQTEEGRRIK